MKSYSRNRHGAKISESTNPSSMMVTWFETNMSGRGARWR
jgi:hypothetical protein